MCSSPDTESPAEVLRHSLFTRDNIDAKLYISSTTVHKTIKPFKKSGEISALEGQKWDF